jgi:hypothetical protein
MVSGGVRKARLMQRSSRRPGCANSASNDRSSVWTRGPPFNDALRLSEHDIHFRLALQDYLRAIVDPLTCAAHCFRAIEGVKSSFNGSTDKAQWAAMHDALKTERNTIDRTVKDHANAIRHGNWRELRPTTNEVRWSMLKLTQDVLRRYMVYSRLFSQSFENKAERAVVRMDEASSVTTYPFGGPGFCAIFPAVP